jgi:uncharacterized protein (TIGR03437 family)
MPGFAQGLWERRAPYPVEATEVSAAALDGKIYALCGILPNGSRDTTLHIYDPYADSWTDATAAVPIPGGGDHCNVAAVGGRLYVLGAIRVGTNFVDGNTYEFDPRTGQWATVGRMSVPRGSSGVAVIGSRLYVAGGLDPQRAVSAMEVFDAESKTWSRLPDMPTARDHLTAQAVGGKIYAIAGRTGATDLNTNEEFDPATNGWRVRAAIPTARGGVGSGSLRNRIQVFGGEGNSGRPEQTFNHHEEYDPATDTWGTLGVMVNPRHGLYGATLDGRIFTPGGGPRIGATFSNTHDAFFLPLPVAPSIRAGGIRNAASNRAELTPGAIVALYGENLSQGEQVASRFPIAGTLNATTVRVNNTAAPVLYVGPNQINFQLPYNTVPGPITVTVQHVTQTSAVFSAPDATAVAPGLFSLTGDGQGQGAILIAGTNLLARPTRDAFSRAAQRGEFVSIYATGLGRLDFPPRTGEPGPTNPVPQTLERPEVTIGGAIAEVTFSGLTPGAIGLFQINARVPATAQTGTAVPVSIRIGGVASNTVTMAVVD